MTLLEHAGCLLSMLAIGLIFWRLARPRRARPRSPARVIDLTAERRKRALRAANEALGG